MTHRILLIKEADDLKRDGRSQEAFARFTILLRKYDLFFRRNVFFSFKQAEELEALSSFTNFKKRVSSFKYTFAYFKMPFILVMKK